MSHKSPDGKQVSPIFLQMCTKSMAEGMTGEPVFPAEPFLVGMDMP